MGSDELSSYIMSIPKDHEATICKLCKRDLPQFVDKTKVKPKIEKEAFIGVNTEKSDQLSKQNKVKQKKIKTAGLVLSGNATKGRVLLPGSKDPSITIPNFHRAALEEKKYEEKKRKLKGLLLKNKQQKKQSSNLQNFLNKIV